MAVSRGPAAQRLGGTGKILRSAVALVGPRRIAVASAHTGAINCLALTGPLYMLVLFDRVLPSESHAGLAAVTAAMLVLYALGACFDVARHRVLTAGARRIERYLAVLAARRLQPMPAREIATIGALLRGQVPPALCDAPWVPLYVAVLALLHPLFAALAVAGAAVLAGCMLLADRRCSEMCERAPAATASRRSVRSRWLVADAQRRALLDAAGQRAGLIAALLRTLRPALQSATLGLGAYLVMIGSCRAGSVLAATIVLSRLLTPIEIILAHWRSIAAAYLGAGAVVDALSCATAGSHQQYPVAGDRGAAAGLEIIVRSSRDYARSATRGGTRSTSSDLRPTAQ